VRDPAGAHGDLEEDREDSHAGYPRELLFQGWKGKS
jgi:hypothetical protein